MTTPAKPSESVPHVNEDERATYNREQLAKVLGIGVATLDRHRDLLPTPIKVGKRLLWSKQAVMDYLNQKTAR